MSYNVPGMTAIVETDESQILASGPNDQHRQIDFGVTVKSTVTDAGNTPTTELRPGNLFGIKDSDGLAYLYSASANDGTQAARGVWAGPSSFPMLQSLLNPTAVNKRMKIHTGGILKNTALLPNADHAGLATLLRTGFVTKGIDPPGSAFGLHFKNRYFKDGTALSGAYTVVAADNGCMLVAITAAMNFTLPDLATVGRGFQVFLYNAVDANMVVTAAANTIITGDAGGAVSTTLTFSTANAKMGSHALMYADYNGPAGTLAWYAMMVNRTVTTA